MIRLTLPQVTHTDLNDIMELFADALDSTEILEDALSQLEPERRQAISAWLEENDIYSDFDFLTRFTELWKAVKEDWQPHVN